MRQSLLSFVEVAQWQSGAFGINDEGVVVGHWSDVNGVVHEYLLFPE